MVEIQLQKVEKDTEHEDSQKKVTHVKEGKQHESYSVFGVRTEC